MKTQFIKWGIGLTFASLLLSISSCREKKKDEVTIEVEDGITGETKGSYVLAVRSKGSQTVASDYLISTDTLMSGELSIVGNGIEQTGYHFYQQTGKYLTTITYTDVNVGTIYKINEDKQLTRHKRFTIDRLHLFQDINEREFLAVNIPFKVAGNNYGTFYQVNAETGTVTLKGKVNLYTPTNGMDEQAVFSGMTLRGDKLFVPFFPIADSDFNSTHTDTAYVAVYSWPDLAYEKRITDDRTGPIGSYASQGHIFTTEDNDIYTVSPCSYSTGASQETRPSGILRIKAGETEFDKGYFLNIEELSGGFKVCNTYYLGGGKVLASIFTTKHTFADRWAREDVKLAIIDLFGKSLTYVTGVPVHYGGVTGMYNNHLMVDDGKVYIKINSAEGLYMYEVDPGTYTGTRGAKVVGEEIYGVFNLK